MEKFNGIQTIAGFEAFQKLNGEIFNREENHKPKGWKLNELRTKMNLAIAAGAVVAASYLGLAGLKQAAAQGTSPVPTPASDYSGYMPMVEGAPGTPTPITTPSPVQSGDVSQFFNCDSNGDDVFDAICLWFSGVYGWVIGQPTPTPTPMNTPWPSWEIADDGDLFDDLPGDEHRVIFLGITKENCPVASYKNATGFGQLSDWSLEPTRLRTWWRGDEDLSGFRRPEWYHITLTCRSATNQ